jgi:hypothetical protein
MREWEYYVILKEVFEVNDNERCSCCGNVMSECTCCRTHPFITPPVGKKYSYEGFQPGTGDDGNYVSRFQDQHEAKNENHIEG